MQILLMVTVTLLGLSIASSILLWNHQDDDKKDDFLVVSSLILSIYFIFYILLLFMQREFYITLFFTAFYFLTLFMKFYRYINLYDKSEYNTPQGMILGLELLTLMVMMYTVKSDYDHYILCCDFDFSCFTPTPTHIGSNQDIKTYDSPQIIEYKVNNR